MPSLSRKHCSLFLRVACINIAHAKLEITDGCRQKMLLPQPLTSISTRAQSTFHAHFPRRHCQRGAQKNIYYIGVARSMFVHSSDINKSMNEKSPTNSCGQIKSFLWKLGKEILSALVKLVQYG